jgi:ParB family chromosome partitioning protein
MTERSKLSKVIKMRSFEEMFSRIPQENNHKNNEQNIVPEKDDEKESKTVKIVQVPIESLISFADNPFKLYSGQKLEDMKESIKENGILTPLVARNINESRYEILSGHNRTNAARIIGLETVPAIIKEDLSDTEARIIVTETNFVQRSMLEMLPSELARSLKMQLEACKEVKKKQTLIEYIENGSNLYQINSFSQGAPMVYPGKSVETVAQNNCMNREDIRRYIRLNNIIEALLNMVDEKQIGLRAAVHLSYLKESEQKLVLEVLDKNCFKLDMKKAEALRSLSEAGKLDESEIFEVLSGQHSRKKKLDKTSVKRTIKISYKLFSPYFEAEMDEKAIEAELLKALEFYKKAHQGEYENK